MPTFNFTTITTAQALALTAADILLIDQGSANATTILFGTNTTTMTVGSTTVVFGAALANATTTYADGSKLYVGTSGNDVPAAFGAENNGLYGGAGNDTLNGGGGVNQLQGNQGDDSLVGGSGYDVIYGGQDNDTIVVGVGSGGGMNFGQGNRGDDTVNGSSVDNDTLLGGQGNDVLGATNTGQGVRSGLFTLYSNPTGLSGGGHDFINGNLGDDIIFGGSGDDTLLGEDGRDVITDYGGRNFVDGGAGGDYITVAGQTTVNGGADADVIILGAGVFVVDLGDGQDACLGLLDGTSNEHATILGGAGRDLIRGTNGSDSIDGGSDRDIIVGWGGADTLMGGADSDEFDFFSSQSSTVFGELDQILDWSSSDIMYFEDLRTGDPVGIGAAFNYLESSAADYDAALAFADTRIAAATINYVIVQVGGDVYVFVDSQSDNGVADSAVRLVGRSLADISFSNFPSIGA